jgi:hypothetical protein
MSESDRKRHFDRAPVISGLPLRTDKRPHRPARLKGADTVAKVEVALVRIFGEALKREAIDDSDKLSRLAEVA